MGAGAEVVALELAGWLCLVSRRRFVEILGVGSVSKEEEEGKKKWPWGVLNSLDRKEKRCGSGTFLLGSVCVGEANPHPLI